MRRHCMHLSVLGWLGNGMLGFYFVVERTDAYLRNDLVRLTAQSVWQNKVQSGNIHNKRITYRANITPTAQNLLKNSSESLSVM